MINNLCLDFFRRREKYYWVQKVQVQHGNTDDHFRVVFLPNVERLTVAD